MITKEGFIQSINIDPERSEKIFNELNDRFDGDWKKSGRIPRISCCLPTKTPKQKPKVNSQKVKKFFPNKFNP